MDLISGTSEQAGIMAETRRLTTIPVFRVSLTTPPVTPLASLLRRMPRLPAARGKLIKPLRELQASEPPAARGSLKGPSPLPASGHVMILLLPTTLLLVLLPTTLLLVLLPTTLLLVTSTLILPTRRLLPTMLVLVTALLHPIKLMIVAKLLHPTRLVPPPTLLHVTKLLRLTNLFRLAPLPRLTNLLLRLTNLFLATKTVYMQTTEHPQSQIMALIALHLVTLIMVLTMEHKGWLLIAVMALTEHKRCGPT